MRLKWDGNDFITTVAKLSAVRFCSNPSPKMHHYWAMA